MTTEHAAADQPGVAALGDNSDAGVMADRHDLGDLIGGIRADDDVTLAVPKAAPFGDMGLDPVGICTPAFWPDDVLNGP